MNKSSGCGCDGKRAENSRKISCGNNCAQDPNKMLDFLESIKSLYQRLEKDVCQYAEEKKYF